MCTLWKPEPNFRLSACVGKPRTIWNGEGDAWVQQGVAATVSDDYWGRFRFSTVTPAICANNEGHVEPSLVNGRSRADKSCITHTERECCAKPCTTSDLMGATCSPTGSQPRGSTAAVHAASRHHGPTALRPPLQQHYRRTDLLPYGLTAV